VAIPLFAFILIPNAIVWIVTGEVLNRLYPGEELSIDIYMTTALITGFVWLAIVVGKLCPPKGVIRGVVLRIRLIFTDWMLEPRNQRAAAEKREKMYQNCEE